MKVGKKYHAVLRLAFKYREQDLAVALVEKKSRNQILRITLALYYNIKHNWPDVVEKLLD